MNKRMLRGIVVLGHGSRASVGEANRVAFQVTDIIKTKLGHDLVEPAIMNTDSGLQTMAEAVSKLVDRGAGEIVVAPMFLSNGAHIRYDIPEEIEIIQKNFPKVLIRMSSHIGPDPRIADILLEKIQEVPACNL